jgi:hypothetical protein
MCGVLASIDARARMLARNNKLGIGRCRRQARTPRDTFALFMRCNNDLA